MEELVSGYNYVELFILYLINRVSYRGSTSNKETRLDKYRIVPCKDTLVYGRLGPGWNYA